ncbi:SHOCT domain-containing protein [Nocardioides sp.]|uniref:SHOCT domain-containing protein n=1 Tax=Nocardioides sp. TaxID=35761 RepID=UPI00356A6082
MTGLTLVVTMMYDGVGWGWGWMMLMPLLWIALLGVIVWAVVHLSGSGDRRAPRDAPPLPQRESALEILDRRLATGEIDQAAYLQARDLIAGRTPRSS